MSPDPQFLPTLAQEAENYREMADEVNGILTDGLKRIRELADDGEEKE